MTQRSIKIEKLYQTWYEKIEMDTTRQSRGVESSILIQLSSLNGHLANDQLGRYIPNININLVTSCIKG